MSKTPSVLKYPKDQNNFPNLDIVYLDTTFILAFLFKHDVKHSSAEALFNCLVLNNNRIKFLLSTLAVDEFWGILLNLLYKSDNNRNINFNDLKWDKNIMAKYGNSLKEHTKKLFDLPPIKPISIDESFTKDALEYMTKYSMGPRDSFHLAAAISNQVNAIISNDTDFDSIESDTIETIIKY